MAECVSGHRRSGYETHTTRKGTDLSRRVGVRGGTKADFKELTPLGTRKSFGGLVRRVGGCGRGVITGWWSTSRKREGTRKGFR